MKNYAESEDLERSDTEITLGMRSILGIFFGLVLVCGVFFGFGYSLGRGNTTKAAPPQAAPEIPEATSPSAVKTVVEEPATSNSAAAMPRPAKPTAAAVAPPPATATTAGYAAGAAPASATQTSYNSAAPAKATPVSYPASPAANPAASIMVQIAAVSQRQDADVLVSALQKLGYSASVRSQADDNLLHVQIGPFATRDQAKLMRAKLLNDGYNAILK